MARIEFKTRGWQAVKATFDGPNGHYNWKRAMLALDKANTSGQLQQTTITFGTGANEASVKAAQAWLTKPTQSNLVLLIGHMMVFGWSVKANDLPLGQGMAQGRRSIAGVAKPAVAQKVLSAVLAKPAQEPEGPSAEA